MAVIDVPAGIGFESCKLTLLRATQTLRSPFTGRRQVVTSAFALWQFEGNVVPLQGTDAGEVRAFLVQLKGQANTFRLPIPASDFPLSNYNGTPGVVGASGQFGTSIATVGWTPNRTLFRKGDYFTIEDQLKVATVDINSNSSGNATLFFEPATRGVVAGAAAISYSPPTVYLAAADDEQAAWGLVDYNTHRVSLKAIEVFE